MPGAFEIRIDIAGQTEVGQHFARAGDDVRKAIVGVFVDMGNEIETRARAASPSKRARSAIRSWVTDGQRNKGTGAIVLRVGTSRAFRWVQQFEFGTVGAGPDAKTGTVLMGVRGYSRREGSGNVFQVVGKTRRKQVGHGIVFVHSYQRHQHMPTKPFMGPAFRSVAPSVVPRVQAAAAAALGKGST